MDPNFLIMGLPASGKTTYLAALWHTLESGEIDCRLQLQRYEGDLKYLNGIAQAWRTFQEVPRTSQVGDMDVSIELIDKDTGETARAFFPDLAGETFDTQVELRRCRPGFLTNAGDGDGVLFFINANVRQDALSIVELNSFMPSDADADSVADVDRYPEGETPQADDKVIKEWSAKLTPAQVRIVQLLTDLSRSPFSVQRRRLAIVISAWDLVTDMNLTPADWLAKTMPFVNQFVSTNEESFIVSTFGVSAQGLRLDDDEAIKEVSKLAPSRRVVIKSSDGKDLDITAPLIWLMSL